MRKIVTVAALLLAAVTPSAASAGIFIGLRGGYAFPLGDIEKDSALKDSFKSEIPLTLDLGLKLGKALAVGAYGGYAFLQTGDDRQALCDSVNQTCTATELRLGVQANLHAVNTANSEFWAGVAVGWNEIRAKNTGGSLPDGETLSKGFEASLQGGLDFLASPSFRIGPYASATVGQFNTSGDPDVDTDIADKTLHGWIQIGLRGMYGN